MRIARSFAFSMTLAAFIAAIVPVASLGADKGNVDLPRYPSVSPDGQAVVYSWRGDLWRAPIGGGRAMRLTSHPAEEYRSAWSRDGKLIAFNSHRSGAVNVHVMNADGTGVRQLTHVDRSCVLTEFGVDEDGKDVVLFYSYFEADPYYNARPYMVSTDGGDLRRVHDAFGARPAVSPNGERVTFTRGNNSWYRKHYRGPGQLDVWLYDRGEKSFKQLTEWTGNDGKATWLNDDTIVFLSDRKRKTVNLYRMDVKQGKQSIRPLTNFKGDDVQDLSVAANGKVAVFTRWDTLYSLDLTDGKAKPRALVLQATEDEADNFTLHAVNREVSEAALSPDGKVMAVVAHGEVFVRAVEDGSPTRRVTESHAHEKDIAWSPDGARLYFTSDRDGTESIYEATVATTRGEIKEATKNALNPEEKKKPKEKKKDEKKPDVKEEENEDAAQKDGNEDAAKSDDDKDKKGEDKSKDDAKPEAKEPELPKPLQAARWQDAMRFDIAPVVKTKSHDREASPSPDGKKLAFRRGRGDLVVLDRTTGEETVVFTCWDTGLHWTWRPDGKAIAYSQADRDFNYDIWIKPLDGSGEAVNVTQHPDNDYNPQFSADGRILNFISERKDEEYDVWMVYLDKSLERLPQPELEDYYKKAAEAAKKRKPVKPIAFSSDKFYKKEKANDTSPDRDSTSPDRDSTSPDRKGGVESKETSKQQGEDSDDATAPQPLPHGRGSSEALDLADAFLRLRRVSSYDGNEWHNALTPAGDTHIFTATGGYEGLWTVKWNGSDRKKIAGRVDVQHLTLAGDKIVFIDNNRAGVIAVAGGAPSFVDIDAKIHIDLQAQSSQKFLEAARILGERYYHPTMSGVNWKKLTKRYHELARHTRTPSEFDYVANQMLGELNGSHLGISAPDMQHPNAQPTGYLGTSEQRVKDGYRVTAVLPDSPAALSPTPIVVDDVIVAVEQEKITPDVTLEELLHGRVGKETIITVRRKLDGRKKPVTLDLLITPTSWGAIRNLRYDAWQRRNAELVHEWSDGKLGYLHVRGMNQQSLDEYERDLYAAAHNRKGLLIDVRNNGGGWTTDRLLASIMARPHAYTVPRGADPSHTDGYPQDRLFIQRYTLPINMLCNEKSFSNAEIISHAFKTLKRGTLIGQQTFGGVISTGGTTLIDGTRVRIPFRGWYLLDGTDMENNGAVPDIIIEQTPQQEVKDEDAQLKAAVEDLLKRVK